MAEQNYDTVEIKGRKKRKVCGSFAPNGNSALVAANTYVSGGDATVTYVSTGLYRINLVHRYKRLLSAVPGLQLATADNRALQFGTYNASAGTLEVRSVDETGTVQDIAADANNRIHFELTFDDALHE